MINNVSSALAVAAAIFCSFTISPALAADAADFAGSWRLEVRIPADPLIGLLELERSGDSWMAHVEGGPAPVVINGTHIEVSVDARGLPSSAYCPANCAMAARLAHWRPLTSSKPPQNLAKTAHRGVQHAGATTHQRTQSRVQRSWQAYGYRCAAGTFANTRWT